MERARRTRASRCINQSAGTPSPGRAFALSCGQSLPVFLQSFSQSFFNYCYPHFVFTIDDSVEYESSTSDLSFSSIPLVLFSTSITLSSLITWIDWARLLKKMCNWVFRSLMVKAFTIIFYFILIVSFICCRVYEFFAIWYFRFWVLYRAKQDGPVVLVSFNLAQNFLYLSSFSL